MRYTPHTAADQERMIREIGVESIEALYHHVPKTLRERGKINLPSGCKAAARMIGLKGP